MHHKTFRLWQTSDWGRIPSAFTLVAILIPLLSIRLGEALPPRAHRNLVRIAPEPRGRGSGLTEASSKMR